MKSTPAYQLPYPEPADNTETWEYWQQLAAKLDSVLGGAEIKTYTPTISGNWVLGNGTATGRYYTIGSLCHVEVDVVAAGTSPTTAWGASSYIAPPLKVLDRSATSKGVGVFNPGSGKYFGAYINLFGGGSSWADGLMAVYLLNTDGRLDSPNLAAGAAWAANANLKFSIDYLTNGQPNTA